MKFFLSSPTSLHNHLIFMAENFKKLSLTLPLENKKKITKRLHKRFGSNYSSIILKLN